MGRISYEKGCAKAKADSERARARAATFRVCALVGAVVTTRLRLATQGDIASVEQRDRRARSAMAMRLAR